jgi:2-oxoglutarate ferredoxin oxidoreductase subunit gamma
MQTEIVIAGFGGQGVLFAGQLLAFAAMDYGKEVTWFPSYGPEMRGGTANCMVIIADEEIGSPQVRYPRAAIVMNLPSLEKYEKLVTPDGILVANGSLINRGVERTDITSVVIPGNEIAEELGNKRLLNVVMLGALVEKLELIPFDAVTDAVKNHLPERHKHLLGMNLEALERGAAYARGEFEKTSG